MLWKRVKNKGVMFLDSIYLDNNATTKIDDEVLSAMLPYLKEEYGNPSSIYSFGADVKEQIKIARQNVAKLLNADLDEIIFTSGASESNTTAIMNAVRNNPQKKHIITTKSQIYPIIYHKPIQQHTTNLPNNN